MQASEINQPHLRECPSRYSQVSVRARKKTKHSEKKLRREENLLTTHRECQRVERKSWE